MKNNTLQYAQLSTYKYFLTPEQLEFLTSKTNRSVGQTQYLFQLVDGNFEKLKQLESQIKNCFVQYCPGDKEEVTKVLGMTPRSNYFSF